MAITGKQFLRLNKVSGLAVSHHALTRLREYTGFHQTRALAGVLFSRSRHIRPKEVCLLGFRPRYHGRKAEVEETWYFRFILFGEELLAVVTRDESTGAYVWVTAYAANEQTQHYRVADFDMLTAA